MLILNPLQVLSGITFTKLIGMSVLGLTRSKFLEVGSSFVRPAQNLTKWLSADLLFPHVARTHRVWSFAWPSLVAGYLECRGCFRIPAARS